MKLHTLLSVADFERRAQALLPRAVLGYVNGGTEDGLTRFAMVGLEDKVFNPVQLNGIPLAGQQQRRSRPSPCHTGPNNRPIPPTGMQGCP